jgi:hypothetical protein
LVGEVGRFGGGEGSRIGSWSRSRLRSRVVGWAVTRTSRGSRAGKAGPFLSTNVLPPGASIQGIVGVSRAVTALRRMGQHFDVARHAITEEVTSHLTLVFDVLPIFTVDDSFASSYTEHARAAVHRDVVSEVGDNWVRSAAKSGTSWLASAGAHARGHNSCLDPCSAIVALSEGSGCSCGGDVGGREELIVFRVAVTDTPAWGVPDVLGRTLNCDVLVLGRRAVVHERTGGTPLGSGRGGGGATGRGSGESGGRGSGESGGVAGRGRGASGADFYGAVGRGAVRLLAHTAVPCGVAVYVAPFVHGIRVASHRAAEGA